MTKVSIKRLDSITKNDTTATEQINSNFLALQEAIENTLSRDGTSPNFMDADLDMNSYRIINSADPVEDLDIVNKKYVEERIGAATEASKTAVNAATQAASSAQSALVSSTNAINTLRNAEEQLNNTITYVDEAKESIDEAITAATDEVKQKALDAANEAINDAAATATGIVIDYANNEVKPLLNEIASNAAESAENASESAGLAANESGNAAISASDSQHYAEDARIWAEGEQAEVELLGGELSSKGWVNLAQEEANNAKTSADRAEKIAQGFDGVVNTIEGSIGDIGFAPLGIDETQNKRRYLNGQVISQSQFASFTAKVKNAILQFPSLGATEENWQAEVTNSKLGQCGKFVIDDELGTIRLPKVVNINGLTDLALMGSIKNESLPNIKGNIQDITNGASGKGEGSFYLYAGAKGQVGPSGNQLNFSTFKFDASRSSSTYQDNAPVQQEAIQYPYFIQVATGVEESVDVTREIELNNPFFFGISQYFESAPNNASWLLSNGAFHSGSVYVSFYQWLLRIYNGVDTVDGVSVKLHTEEYGDYDYVLNTADTTFRLPLRTKDDFVVENYESGLNWYRVYKSGWIEQGGYHTFSSDIWETQALHKSMKNSKYLALATLTGSDDQVKLWKVGSELKNTTTTVYLAGYSGYAVRWYVSGQGAETPDSKTYFYVGETIQDANVINAAGVLTRVANSIDRTVASDRETVVGWGMPDYSAAVFLGDISTNPYIVPYDGWYNLGIDKAAGNTSAGIIINGVGLFSANYSNTYSSIREFILLKAGDKVGFMGVGVMNSCYYLPIEGQTK